MDFEPGDKIDGLHIERELGRGAFGVVYLARDELIGRPVALKLVAGEHAASSELAREQVLAEARLVGALNSPHVVTLYRVQPAPRGGWMLQMEFVGGGCLADELESGSPLPVERAVEVFRGVCLALKAAHTAGVLHGDIKPGNVLFGSDRLVKLADFGMARMLGPGGAPTELFGRSFGTPRFMAPEVMTGARAGREADLWSAAVLFHLCLTGRYPFPAETYNELSRRVLCEDPEPIGSGVPPELSALVRRCLEKEPAARPGTVSEVIRELDDIVLRVLSSEGPALHRQRLTNCEVSAATFVGRESECEDLAGMVSSAEQRIVTITGAGGVGKTRLAQEVCLEFAARLEGGAWFADLSESDEPEAVAHVVAHALGVELPPQEDAVAALSNVLQFRPPLLLVLDNFEQLVDVAPATVGAWSRTAPQIRFLVTSRELLGVAGERSYELAPLATPPLDASQPLDVAAALRFPAVRLFVDRAREADRRFRFDEETAPHVQKICGELDGIPLAIELAAARARVLRPVDIAGRLEKKFQILSSSRRDLSPRQRTLTAAIEWSYDLLEPWEREAFLQVCCFRDGFSLDAVDSVVDLDGFEDAPLALDVAQSLRDKSLLTATDTGYEHRLGMYRAIREFGASKWRERADDDRRRGLALRHARYFLSLSEEWGARIPGPRDQEALDRIAIELGNLAAAQDRALDLGETVLAARLVLASAETARLRRPSRQLVVRLAQSLDALGAAEPALRAPLLVQLSAACQVSGEWDRAALAADEAVALAREWKLPGVLAEALLQQGEMRRNRGDSQGALDAFEECEARAREAGARHLVAASIGDRGISLGGHGDYDGALACFEEASSIAREIGDHQTLARHVSNRGIVLESRGRPEDAIACHREAEELSRRIGNRLRIALSLGNRANLHVQTGDIESGMSCYREAEAIARELGAKQSLALIVGNRGSTHTVRGEESEALSCFELAESIAREIGDARRLAFTLGKKGTLHAHRGEHDPALACYDEAERIGEEIGDPRIVAINRCQRGQLFENQGRIDEAWEALRSGIALYDEMHANRSAWYFGFKCDLATLAEARGDAAEARSLAEEALDLAAQLGLDEDRLPAEMRASMRRVRTIAGAS